MLQTKLLEEALLLENPLSKGLPENKVFPPCAMVVFGASGDLTARKIIPALWHLHESRLLPDRFAILGIARSESNSQQFRDEMREAVAEFGGGTRPDGMLWDSFAERLHYLSGNYDDPKTFENLKQELTEIDRQFGTAGNRLFYLATPPVLFIPILESLQQSGLSSRLREGAFTRVVIEKPFGNDQASARALNQQAVRAFGEQQVYRIDHYLGKETVQNILIFRFANGIFEPIWNRRYIDHVQITSAETVGVENRAGYYDRAGALRDMFQNHMLQLLCLVATEPPARFDARSVRDEKSKALQSVRLIKPDELLTHTIRGQYGAGAIAGSQVPGYLEEPGVAQGSKAETYSALKLYVDNWRFAGVPFYLRSGKRMAKRATEISIQFKHVPHLMLRPGQEDEVAPNVLTIRIQPDEGISLDLEAKIPGLAMRVRPVQMDFRYGTAFGRRSPEAYERLILDALTGDQMLFARGDWVETSWSLIDPILLGWEETNAPLPVYEAGSWGPSEADQFMERDGRRWRRP